MRKLCVLLLTPLLFTACEANPTDPSPRIPSVAAQYLGTTNFSPIQPPDPRALTCRTTTSVTQNGTTVSIAPLQMSDGQNGSCPTSITLGETTINETGAMVTTVKGTFSVDPCIWNYTASGGFVQRDLRMTMDAGSPTDCYNLHMNINLTRQ